MKMKEKIKEDLTFITPPHTRSNFIMLKVCRGATVLTIARDINEIVKFAEENGLIYKSSAVDFTKLKNTNIYYIYFIDGKYSFDELLELGYNFKEINKILKQQEEK